MNDLIQIMGFIMNTTNGIFQATDSVYLGNTSLLTIFTSLMYLEITFWGVFTLISYKKNASNIDEEK